MGTITTNTVVPSHSCRRHNKNVEVEIPSPSTLYMGKRVDGLQIADDKLISFRSDQGKRLLVDCIQSGSSENYLSLSEQFLTQSSPPSCGVATLAMVLNSLKVDPGRVWRKPWRWFTEEMLISCFPLEKSEQTLGLTMEHFGLIAECNGATAQTFYGSNISLPDFRRALEAVFVSTESERRLVVAFDRAVLGQTGTGHYSPIGAYHRESDMCLVLDVARFKYPPYWVPVELMWESLRTVDPETRRSRGFFIMSRAPLTAKSASTPNSLVSESGLGAVVLALLDSNNHRLKEIAADLVHGVRKRLLICPCIRTTCDTLIDCSSYKGGNELLSRIRELRDIQIVTKMDSAVLSSPLSETEMRPIDFFIQSMPQLVNELITLLVIEHGNEFIDATVIDSILNR
jgi:hypothetical protein